MDVVTEFQIEVDLKLSPTEKRTALRALNVYHIGKEEIPITESFPPGKGGVDMEKIQSGLHMLQRTKVTVQLLEDGSLVLKQ